MVFSSIPFLCFFLPLCLVLYFLIPGKGKNAVLLVFSLFFYAWGEPVYILLMLLSTLVDYTDGLLLTRFKERPRIRVLCLSISLLINLSLLGIFKYAGFFGRIWNGISILPELSIPEIALPIGISFYTFQTMSYSIDVYRGEVEAERNYLRYLTYVSMFPQLIAGPIVRYTVVQKELREREINGEHFVSGMRRFFLGLFRKVLIANQMGELFTAIREEANGSALCAWIGLIAAMLQIYYDFSAYSDMAIGLGEVLGFHFPENFNYPMAAVSITDFWRRWHISLSSWFRDYVYIPLGGNRVGKFRRFANIIIVWFLTGLWHGAFWNYIFWGLYQALLLILEKYVWGKWLEKRSAVFRHIYTWLFMLPGFGLFVFEDLPEMGRYALRLLGLSGNSLVATDILWYGGNYFTVLAAALILSFPLYPKLKEKLALQKEGIRAVVSAGFGILMIVLLTVSLAMLVRDSYNPFLYFRF